MRDADITIVDTHGRTLSLYLKDYLATKAIPAFAVGMQFKNLNTMRKIKNAKTVICVHPDIHDAVTSEFDLSGKQVICLDVSETPDTSSGGRHLTGELWLEYQRDYVYPELEKQIQKYLKKLA